MGMPLTHYTAWLNTGTGTGTGTDLGGEVRYELLVTVDEIEGHDATGAPQWAAGYTRTRTRTYRKARDSDARALREAQAVLERAEWTLAGQWERVSTGFAVEVSPHLEELWVLVYAQEGVSLRGLEAVELIADDSPVSYTELPHSVQRWWDQMYGGDGPVYVLGKGQPIPEGLAHCTVVVVN
ncbi:hypothetical protein ACFQ61_34435 [Streptomyces sp. NPDC056500]|uniref:hypothetical protein n=1 Tax=Streptomyces sp. NPDC056500 TaxID=3345840 RepID=UPI00368AE9DD